MSALKVAENTHDLVDAYDRTLSMVPALVQKLEDMQQRTADKAAALQDKMKRLIEGYEHVENVSSTVRYSTEVV